MKKVVVMASGEGSNFSAIVDFGIKVDRVITDNPNANVIKRAEKVNVLVDVIPRNYNISRTEYDNKLPIPEDTDLIVLAGWTRLFSDLFCEKWKNKMVNIHPSLLPAFGGGCHAIEDTWNYGCTVFGITVHWVIPEVDAGPIITQRAIHKLPNDTLKSITEKLHRVEHYVYPETIKKLIS